MAGATLLCGVYSEEPVESTAGLALYLTRQRSGWSAGRGRRRRRSRNHRLRRWYRSGLSDLGPGDIDAAREVCAVLDHDARGLDVAHQFGILADVDFVGRFHVAMDG